MIREREREREREGETPPALRVCEEAPRFCPGPRVKYDTQLSRCAFNVNVRPHNKAAKATAAAADTMVGRCKFND